MSQKLYKKAEKFVLDSYSGKAPDAILKHFTRTAYWVKRLKPSADEAFLIAAVSHDIERAFRDPDYSAIKDSNKGFKDENHIIHHQNKGAEIMDGFLKKEGASEQIVNRVKMLISKHEIGGNKDQNILKDADSISFFENNIDYFIKEQIARTSKQKVKEKFDYMFERITIKKAKEIAHPWYKKALKKLD